MKSYTLTCLAFIVAAIQSMQSVYAEDSKVHEVPSLTRVVIRNGDWGGLAIKWIDTPVLLKSIAKFFNENRKGWTESEFGSAPVGSLAIDLYSGMNCCGRFGIGDNFLACGSLQNTSIQKRDELLRLIGELPTTISAVVLPAISNITKIVVSTNLAGGASRQITERDRIHRIVEFINQQRTGWDKHWTGEFVPNATLTLMDRDGFVVQFGIGTEFFETCSDQTFIDCRSKRATRQQTDDILTLVQN